MRTNQEHHFSQTNRTQLTGRLIEHEQNAIATQMPCSYRDQEFLKLLVVFVVVVFFFIFQREC